MNFRKRPDAVISSLSQRGFTMRPPTEGILIALLLVAVSVPGQAEETLDTAPVWDNWQALSAGYVGRRKVPPRLNNEPAQRPLAEVQHLESRQQQQLLKLQASGPFKADGQAMRQVKQAFKTRTASLKQTAANGAGQKKTVAVASAQDTWLFSATEGLYRVSLTDLALYMGVKEKSLANNLIKGVFALTVGAQPTTYYYDKDSKELFYTAQAYQTFYTDHNVYRAGHQTGSDRQPMRMKQGNAKNLVGTAKAFRDRLHFEEEPDMYFQPAAVRAEADADYWFWDFLYGGFKDSIEVTLEVPNPAPTGSAQLRVRLRGWTDLYQGDEHQVWAELNGVEIGLSPVWDAFDEMILQMDFEQSLLDPSGANSLVLKSLHAEGTSPGEFLDDIELDYERLPVAQNGQIWLHGLTKGKQQAAGFGSDDLLVIENPAGQATLLLNVKVEQDGSTYTVHFNSRAGKDYLVAERAAAFDSVLAQVPSSNLKDTGNTADYLIIAPRDFASTARALADLRSTRFADVRIVWLDEIYTEFSDGRVDPFALTRFIGYVNDNWLPSLTDVVILGKATLDHKDRMGYADSFVPTLMTTTPWGLATSDDRLLGGNGDAPFNIGRIPIITDVQGQAYVNKLSTYEATVPGTDWYRAVLVADNPDVAGDFYTNSDVLANWLTESLGFSQTTKLYHPLEPVRSELTAASTWDSHGYISYDGHGTITQIGDGGESFIKSTDAASLNNSNYPLFTALTCAAGNYSIPGTTDLATALILNPTGGAIAAMAPTGLSLDLDAQILGDAYVGLLFGTQSGTQSTIGEAVQQAKTQTTGETHAFMQRIYSVVGDTAVHARQ